MGSESSKQVVPNGLYIISVALALVHMIEVLLSIEIGFVSGVAAERFGLDCRVTLQTSNFSRVDQRLVLTYSFV
jgi:hypothetical protein